jgi:hypothetical protein
MKHPEPEKAIREILARLARLEAAVFGKKERKASSEQKENFSGPTGGVRLLISKNFFRSKRNLGEVRTELTKHEYHYSAQAVHEALKRLSGKDGSLVALMEGKTKLYVKRK